MHRSQEEMLKHYKVIHLHSSEDAIRVEREIFICDICNQIFFHKQMLLVHIKYSHIRLDNQNPSNQVECPICLKKIKLRAVWFHFQTHNVQSVSACRICYTKCKDRPHLIEHAKKHPKYLLCTMCQYEAKSDLLFKHHIITKHKSTNKVFYAYYKKCFMAPVKDLVLNKICGFRGLVLTNGVHICVLCREIGTEEDCMMKHVSVEHNICAEKEVINHRCLCGEVFLNKILLKHHVFKMKDGHGVTR
ncbi:zinc finger protein 687a-like [Leptidea sinapis]|uniref:zinc finger protein 687a-like n=1 Tax=Leptidea sinapis TaxID=189913 RepID=UPI00213E135D|nr:zinc finger protein 687a-like [Leptidea sinapis]